MKEEMGAEQTVYGIIYPGEEDLLAEILDDLFIHQIEPDENTIQNLLQQYR